MFSVGVESSANHALFTDTHTHTHIGERWQMSIMRGLIRVQPRSCTSSPPPSLTPTSFRICHHHRIIRQDPLHNRCKKKEKPKHSHPPRLSAPSLLPHSLLSHLRFVAAHSSHLGFFSGVPQMEWCGREPYPDCVVLTYSVTSACGNSKKVFFSFRLMPSLSVCG